MSTLTRLEFDWVFHTDYEIRKDHLIKLFRPMLQAAISKMFREMHTHLRKQPPKVQSCTKTEQWDVSNDNTGEQVFFVVGMIVNRTLPPSATVWVMPTQETANTAETAWNKGADMELRGKP